MTSELLRALAALAEPPGAGQRRIAAALELPGEPSADAYTDLFVLQLPPYASVYTGPEGMLGGEARERVADFFAVLDVAVGDEPDHLATLLGAYATLAGRDDDAAVRVRAALLTEHVLSWLPVYLLAAEAVAAEPYGGWAALLLAALERETGVVASLGQPAASGPPGAGLPLHLREAPGLDDARTAGAAAFLDGLLAPARSGVVVSRADLARAARELGLAARAGERRYALTAMLSQDRAGPLGWLAAHARTAAGAYERRLDWLGATGGFWAGRARVTAQLLEDLAAEAVASHGSPAVSGRLRPRRPGT